MPINSANKKILPAIFISALAVIFIIQAIAATALFFTPTTAQAANNNFVLEVPIGSFSSVPMGNSTKPIADYIKAIYNYAVGAVGIVAAVVLMIGGVMWITAGGNTSSVSEATSMIKAALTGMVLVLCSYLLLDQINPALVDLQADIIQTAVSTPVATTVATQQCFWKDSAAIPSGISGISTPSGACPNGLMKATDNTLCKNTQLYNQVCCCQTITITTGTGSCAEVTDGSCSSANMSVFGTAAAQASAICQGESHGSPGIPSGTDICADGNVASWGLFQINITANPIGGYDCPSAFSGGAYTASNHNCRVVNTALFANCVNAAKDPTTNTQTAFGIYSNAGSWKPWGFYQRNCSSAF